MKILTVPNPILRQESKKIKKIDKKLANLIKKMIQALKGAQDPEGGALAAPQVGKLVRLFIVNFDNVKREEVEKVSKKTGVVAFINPQITKRSKKTLKGALPKEKWYLEGCLSIPKIYGFVNRPYKITIKYHTLADPNDPQSITEVKEEFEGLEASFVQHEYDHLNGILFTDHVLKQRGKLYELRKNKQGEEEFVEVEV